VEELNRRLIDGLDDLRATVVTPRKRRRRGALVCVRSRDVNALVAALRREGIVTSSRAENLRISAHAYNSVDDVDLVLESLARHRSLLA
jgi:selenocysteine lyase/cysteine desulfurase